MKVVFGAPFSKVFYTSGEITAVDAIKAMATAVYHDKHGNRKTAEFKVNNELGYTLGEIVSVQLVDEFVFILKNQSLIRRTDKP